MIKLIKWLFWFGWLRSVRNKLRHWLGVEAIFQDQDFEIGKRLELNRELKDLKCRLEELSTSFLPVVLVKARGIIEEGIEYEACWHLQAEKHEKCIRLAAMPMYGTRVIESVTLLNGPYVITNVRIASMSAIDNGIHPAGKPYPIPPKISRIQVGQSLCVTLERA